MFVQREHDELKRKEKLAYAGMDDSTAITDHDDWVSTYRAFIDPVLLREHLKESQALLKDQKPRIETTPEERCSYYQKIGLGVPGNRWEPAPWQITREDVAELFNLYTDDNKLFAFYEFVDYVSEYEEYMPSRTLDSSFGPE